MQKVYACLTFFMLTLPALGVAQTFDTSSIHSAAALMSVIFNTQKQNRTAFGETVYRAQDFLYPDAIGSRVLGRSIRGRIENVLRENNTDLSTVARALGEIVDDLETGGLRLNDFFKNNLGELDDIQKILLGLYFDENYRGVRTGTPLAQRDVNLLTTEIQVQPLGNFARMDQNSTLQILAAYRSQRGGTVALKFGLAGTAAVLGGAVAQQFGYTSPTAVLGLAGGAGLAKACWLALLGRMAPPEAKPKRFQ